MHFFKNSYCSIIVTGIMDLLAKKSREKNRSIAKNLSYELH